ncbi:hypothetical protein [Streptosporangium sp. NPDC048865]|uniref:hypothetical protein n=1 Tax=Streptosporangium sp. NPDC048865 TaxID=3155766 RepID=UPI0034248321
MDRDHEVDVLITAWENLLGAILKLLGRQGITVPLPGQRVLPGLTQAALQRTLFILNADDTGVPGVKEATTTIIVRWLAAGDILENAYGDPSPWRLAAGLLFTREVQDRIEEINEVLDWRDSQN